MILSKYVLTQLEINRAEAKPKEYLLGDGSGLFLRVRPNGEKDWLFKYSFANKRCKLGLGSFRYTSLRTARVEADSARDQLAKCIDPKMERARREAVEVAEREEIKSLKSRMTIGTLFEEWFAAEPKQRSDGGQEVLRTFTKDVLPAIGERYAEEMRRLDIIKILDMVKQRGVGVMTRNMLGDIRQMFNYALLRDYILIDPTFGLKRDTWGKKTERDRFLDEDEIRLLAVKLPQSGMSKSSTASIWLLLATGCRVGEISATRWEHIDLAKGKLFLPAGSTKNRVAHTIFLSDFAKQQLLLLRGEEPESPFILPGRRSRPDAPWISVCPKSLSKQLRDRQLGANAEPMSNRSQQTDALVLPGGRWTAHDLRRSCATLMGQYRVAPHIIEKCLNHADPNKMQRIYQRQSTQVEQKEAWELIGHKLHLLST
jgi:integrase